MAQTIKLKRSGTSGAIPTTSQLELGEVAINTYDGKMYIKKNVGGTESIVEVTVAAADAIVVEYQFTATANQTTFSGSDDNSETLSYSAGAVQIFLNGILLDSGVDYTATNGTSIVLSEVVDANDYLQVFAFKKKISNGQTTVDTFTGDNSTTAFTLSVNPGDENNTRVYIDGVYQSKSNYSVSGTTLTFSTAPPTSTAIEVEIGNRVVTLDTASNLDLPDNVRLRLGTGQDMQLYHDGSNSYLLGTGGSGSLLTRADLFAVQDSSNINMIQASSSTGQVSLYYNTGSTGAIKLRTTSTGVTVTGTAVADAFNVSSGGIGTGYQLNGGTVLNYSGGNVVVGDLGAGVLLEYNGSTKLSTTSTGVTVTGTAAADALSVDNITIDGIEINSSSSLMLDIAGNLTVNVDGTTVTLADDTINFGQFYNNASGQFNIYAPTQDKDIVFLGNDGGSTVTALTLDMSNAGKATFNHDVAVGGSLSITDSGQAQFGTGNDMQIYHNGAVGEINNNTGTFTIDSADDIILDAAGNDVILKDNGTTFGQLTNDSGNLIIYNSGSQMLKGLSTGSNAQFMGRVGINEASPDALLHITGQSNAGLIVENGAGNAPTQPYVSMAANNYSSGYGTFRWEDQRATQASPSFIWEVRDGSGSVLAYDFRTGATGASGSKLAITQGGNVGIGITNPSTSLHIDSGTAISQLTLARSGQHSGLSWSTLISDFTGGGADLIFDTTGANTGFGFRPRNSNGTQVNGLIIAPSGNIGIGTTTPNSLLHILADGGSSNSAVRIRNSNTTGRTTTLQLEDYSGALADGVLKFVFPNAGSTTGSYLGLLYNSAGLYVVPGGNIGINTTTPDSKLTVNVTSNSDGIELQSSETKIATFARTAVNSQVVASLDGVASRPIHIGGIVNEDVILANAGGNVGIGTSSPFAKSHIVDTSWSSGAPYGTVQLIEGNNVNDNNWGHLVITDTSTANGNGGAISFATGASNALNPFAGIKGVSEGTSFGGLSLFTRESGGTATERMNINSEGLVTVSGDLRLSNTTSELKIHGTGVHTRKLVLYDGGQSNIYQFYGLGVESSSFINSIYSTTDSFYWYAGTSSTARSQAMSLSGSGNLSVSGGLTVTSTSNLASVNGTYFSDGYVTWNAAQFNRSGAAIEFQFTPTASTWQVKIGANGPAPTVFNAYTGDADFSGEVTAEDVVLNSLSGTTVNPSTAVDVFVYDTRNDSDGGEWRKRVKHTSWYNETLNTSTRGARKDFPQVALIVVFTSGVDIYDGDDPDTPIWMQFSHSGYGNMLGENTNSTVSMLNGRLVLGCNPYDMYVVDFIQDKGWSYSNSSSITGTYFGNISERNIGTARDDSLSWTFGNLNSIVNRYIHHVDMAVRPNAPVDPVSGLPIPIIAAATAGGVSVILENGNIVDVVSNTLSHETPRYVKFMEDELFYLVGNNYDQGWKSGHKIKIPQRDFALSYLNKNETEAKYTSIEWSTRNTDGTDLIIPIYMNNPRTAAFIDKGRSKDELIFAGKGSGMHGGVVRLKEEFTNRQQGMLASIGVDHNSGYQVGRYSKLASLCETTTGNLVASDVLSGKGAFSSASDWSAPSGWSVSGGVATGTAVTNYLTPATNGILTTEKMYKITITQSAYTSGAIYVYAGQGAPGAYLHYDSLPSAVGTYTLLLRAYNTNFGIYGANYTGTIDNVTIVECETDYSQLGYGIAPNGTIQRAVVATGADLVGYYGWGTNNYFEQPYTNLNIGSGDFCMMWWQKKDALTGNTAAVPIEFSNPDVDTDGTPSALVFEYQNKVRFYTRGTSGGWHYIQESKDLLAATWQCYAVVRRNGKKEIWRNGELVGESTHNDVDTRFVTSTSTIIRVGKRSDGAGSPFDGMLALVRVTGTAPTPEQIAYAYAEERPLFAVNAKATIGGSSNAVTGLSYDDGTDLLHVGTSWGRSVFQGLNRTEFLTDVIGVAISARNGSVLEE